MFKVGSSPSIAFWILLVDYNSTSRMIFCKLSAIADNSGHKLVEVSRTEGSKIFSGS